MKIYFLILLLILSACKQNTSDPTAVELKLLNEWIYAYSIDELKFNGETITRPPGVTQLLFSLKIPTDGGTHLKTHCVYYQVPYKKIPGVLKIEELKTNEACPEVSSGDLWAQLEDVKELMPKFENFKLSFDFLHAGKKYQWSFVFPNVSNGLVHEKFQPVKEKKWRSGMMFMRINEDSFQNSNNKYLGKISDRVSLGSAIRCQQVDKNCQNVGENRCDDCRYGWYQVVDYQCPEGGSKFCGQNHCGEKNEPACPRGSKVVDAEDAGICQNDLTPVLNAEHILICQ